MSSLRRRRPDRKSSTPFFPGAWPDNSTQDVLAAPELPTHVDRHTQTKTFEPTPLANLDHVTDFHRRLSRSILSGPRTPLMVTPSVSGVSAFSNGTNNTVSPTLATPENISPIVTSSPPKQYLTSWQDRRAREHTRAKHNHNGFVGTEPHGSGSPYLSSNADLRTSHPPHLPLSLPVHTLSFSPESVASYFSTLEQDPRIGTKNLGTPSPPTSAGVHSPLSPELPSITVSSDFAESFYPVLEGSRQPHLMNENLLSHSPTNAVGTDSPILPSGDNSPGRSPQSRSSTRRPLGHGVAPSAADMYAFGMSARNHSSASSVHSIPTSFVSGYVADSDVNQDSFFRADTTGEHPYARPSSPLSFSLNLSTDTLSLPDPSRENPGSFWNQAQANPPHIGIHPHKKVVTTVIGGGALDNHQGSNGSVPNRFLNFKAWGQKIKKAISFRSKPDIAGGGKKIGVTTTTSVTAVEYASEGPIPLPDACRQTVHQHERLDSRERLLRETRRKSMPARTTGLDLSRPLPPRPTSFLAMDYGPTLSRDIFVGQRRLLPSSSGNWISRQPRSSLLSPSKPPLTYSPWKEKQVDRRTASHLPNSKHGMSSSHSEGPISNEEKKSGRFSLSTSNKSRIDVLRTAIMPHPPLLVDRGPELPVSKNGDGNNTDATENLADVMVHDGLPLDTTYEVIDISSIESQVLPKVERKASNFKRSQRKSSVFQTLQNTHPISEAPQDGSSKRRSRGFSLTKRALKGKSLPVGRQGGSPPLLGLPSTSTTGYGWETLLKGLHPHKDAKEHTQLQRSGSSMGCAEYDPDLVIDAMSFAQTPDIPSSTLTSTDHSNWASPEPLDVPVHAIQMDGLGESSTVGTPGEDTNEVERDRVDREEERGFLRALGLEFDAIARRVEEQV